MVLGNRRGTVTIYRFNHFYHLSVCLVDRNMVHDNTSQNTTNINSKNHFLLIILVRYLYNILAITSIVTLDC